MVKRILVFLFAIAAVFSPVYAQQAPDPEKVEAAFMVIADCVNASLACGISPVNVELHSVTRSVDGETSLPVRYAFFLADPGDIRNSIDSYASAFRQSFFSNLFSVEVTVARDSYLVDIGETLASREYRMSDYLLTGSVTFSFPEDMDAESLDYILRTRPQTEDFMKVGLNLGLFGTKVDGSLFIEGEFCVSVAGDGSLLFTCENGYKVNGISYEAQTFFY